MTRLGYNHASRTANSFRREFVPTIGRGDQVSRCMLGTVAGQSVLASRLDGQTAVFQSILLFGAVILVTVLGVVFLLHLRRRIRSGRDSGDRWLSFDTLRKLRDCGKISTAEYDALRKQTIRAMRGGLSSESRTSVR